ncbi:Kelch repeat-containing protein [Dawidia soli]|uniref:Uncharacterized protein n=1 Tax=Dawidia soli TaxID=2782352 RepID=A0AAP2DDX0_9BACT|nr:kelch repeat-containing protein [Dawidia soli]MBT1688960.1 hypothetical protein [Dawidia soli]
MSSLRLPVYTVLVLIYSIGTFAQNKYPETTYGLEFASHEVAKDFRTSLNLTPASAFQTSDDIEVSFTFRLKRLFNTYGYVMRIVANDSLNFDLVSSPETEGFHDFNFIINNQKTDVYFDYEELGIKRFEWGNRPFPWATITIRFDTRKNLVSITWNNKVKTHAFPAAQIKQFRLFFGSHDFGKFKTADVPPMIIKDIRISLDGGRNRLAWDLRNHGTNEVYDNTLEHLAQVRNPIWLIDRHITWSHKTEFKTGKYPSAAFDPTTGNLYISDIKNLTTFNTLTGILEKVNAAEGNVAYIDANQLVYVPETGELINYDFRSNVYSHFDFANSTWENGLKMYKQPHYWHNNKFYNPFDSTLYTFGGYGYYVYKNKFRRYNAKKHAWESVQTAGDSIPPRYLSALGLTASQTTAYIFGGYGSESGKQELFPQSYYDLYSYDLKTHTVKKVWEFKEHGDEEIAFSNSLIVNEADSCFYVLSFPKNKYHGSLRLRKYLLSDARYTGFADSIPFQFHDEYSFCDLFLSKATQELIAVTAHKNAKPDTAYTVHVYSISYPPLRKEDVVQAAGSRQHAGNYWIIGIAGILGIALAYQLLSKRRVGQPHAVFTGDKITLQPLSDPDPIGHLVKGTEIINALPEDRKIVSTVFLFGDFQVFDKNGNDITSKFSTTLKELFVLLVLSSVKQEKGISTASLREHLWSEKDEISARNNRNVTITKLRAIFEEIGDIKIENTHNYVRLVIGEGVFCDYQIASKILHSAGDITHQTVDILMRCVKRGNLVPNLTAGWLDNYKSDVSNMVIDSLLAYSQKLDVNRHDHALLEIADIIFKYDSINQEALVLKCSILNNKGKYSLAKTWYDHFVKEYKALYAENYPKTFEQVIS